MGVGESVPLCVLAFSMGMRTGASRLTPLSPASGQHTTVMTSKSYSVKSGYIHILMRLHTLVLFTKTKKRLNANYNVTFIIYMSCRRAVFRRNSKYNNDVGGRIFQQ